MQLSTVKRESLIPPAYLLSIALLLTVAFVVLLPSRETFSFTQATVISEDDSDTIDELDLAYLKAREAAGDLPPEEMRNVISSMIRSNKWQQALQLMADRPEIILSKKDNFLLQLESATAGYFNAENKARSSSYEATLVELLNEFLDNTNLHDDKTLERAASITAQLGQPEMSASYNLLLAINDPENAVAHLQECARVLAHYDMYGQAAECYRTAISNAKDNSKIFFLKRRLIVLLAESGDKVTANAELEKLIATAPRTEKELSHLATLALASERPDLAYPIYAELSQIDDSRAIMWLEKAATWSEASNLPGLAAEYVLTIEELSDAQYQIPLAKRRQKLLLAAGRNDEALQTLHQRLRLQPQNAELLLEGVELARGMGLVSQAIEWNEQLLSIRPFDIDSMQRQVDFSLASNQVASALEWAKLVVENDPLNKRHRLKLAQLEEWNGNPVNAQQQRMWLAKNHPTNANNQEIIRLAVLNWDAGTAADTLLKLSQDEPLSTENVIKLVKLYEQDGRPRQAAAALEQMMTGNPQDAMLLRELAALHKRHNKLELSLQAWQSFASRFGQSSEASVNQMELQWRLKRGEQSLTASAGINPQYLGNASQYQIKLISELGWRYRQPDLVIAAAPHLSFADTDTASKILYSRRMVQSLVDKSQIKQAIEYSERMWKNTNEEEFLTTAMYLALSENVYPHEERYLDANGDLIVLREMPDYWLQVADYYVRNSDTQAALETYENTLIMQPDNAAAIAGIIWTLLGDDNRSGKLADALDKYQSAATDLPELWSPYAVGYMKINQPKKSLRWFSKLMVRDDHDYNVLLTFADALDQTGNPNHAYKVRNYTLEKLRPLAIAEAAAETNALARNYVGLLQRYGSAGENEVWAQRLLNELPDSSESEAAWRREMATSWYLTTQRNDYARLIMTKMHEKRVQTPAWQQLALALNDNDLGTVREILASGKQLATGDRILALRKIGHERQAYIVAKNTLENSGSESDRQLAREHLLSLRNSRPGYYAGKLAQQNSDNLDVTESGLSLRHTLVAADLGFAVDYTRSNLASSRYALNNDIEDDIAVSAYFGNSKRGGRLTAGMNSRGEDDQNYTSGQYYVRDNRGRKELTTEVSFNEAVEGSTAALRLAAKQDRAELAYQHSLGNTEFLKLSGNLNEISTRGANEKISTGVGASIELGTRGTFGSNSWTMGLIATSNTSETSAAVPANVVNSTQFTTLANVRTNQSQQVALSAALFRGGINSDYPQAASPRYHMKARLGHNWPDESLALQLRAGAGFRLLGNDELSFEVNHDQLGDLSVPGTSSSMVGIQYRNHF